MTTVVFDGSMTDSIAANLSHLFHRSARLLPSASYESKLLRDGTKAQSLVSSVTCGAMMEAGAFTTAQVTIMHNGLRSDLDSHTLAC